MEIEHILKLIDTVSDSSLTAFSMEEGNFKISMKKEKEQMTVSIPEKQQLETVYVEEVKKEAPKGNIVTSPLVGTFYSAASPESDDFVKTGDKVSKGQTLGIVEAMKLMNEIESEFEGTVEEILVENGQMVEYGQPLFRIG